MKHATSRPDAAISCGARFAALRAVRFPGPWRLLGVISLLSSSVWAQNGAQPSAQPSPQPSAETTKASSETGASTDAAIADDEEIPAVIPPQVQHYEPPVYPPEAFEQGIEAEVQVFITVGEDGKVSDPEVVEKKGHGFDEAAVEAAKKLVFSPALVEGLPRAVRIGYQYSFTIDESEQLPAEQEAPKVGELAGTVLISATESPLPGATVTAVDALGNVYPTTTDAEGKWRIEALTPGTYELHIESEGFSPVHSEELVEAGAITDIKFRILPQATEDEVIIQGERPPREMTRRTIERREMLRLPGTNGDALRSIQSLPGVARPPGLAGLLIVRGSAPNATGTFVDGASIPLIYHFGGLSSVVPTELLDRIDFYPGNFSVRYGRFMGGIVDAGLRRPNTDCYDDYATPRRDGRCYHGMAQVDFIDGRMLVQGPVPGTDHWSFAVAGRRSWIDVLVKPILEGAGTSVKTAPVYYDYQAIVERNKGPSDKLSFRVFGSDDRLAVIIEDPAAQDPGFGGNVRFGTAFIAGQVLYQKQLSTDTNIDAMVTAGKQRLNFQLGGRLKFLLDTYPINVRSEIGHRIVDSAKINVGFDFQMGQYEVFVRAPPLPPPGQSNGPLATQVPVETETSGFSFRPAWYADLEWQPSRRLRFVPGIRLDYARDSGFMDLSPRLNARYSLYLPEDHHWGGKKTVLKAGAGKFSQPPEFQETDPVFGTPYTESNQSIHYSVGVEQDLTKQLTLSLEGYYKSLYHQVSGTADPSGGTAYENDGSGHVVGMETLLKYNADERFFGWVAYTLSRSVVRNCPDCELNKFQYDQTHNLIILGSYRLGRGWEFGARFRIVSGPLVTPVNSGINSLFAGDAGTYVPLQGKSYSERLPLFHQLDLRVDKRFQFRTWQLSTYLDVQNVYNRATAEAYVYNFNYSQKAYQTGLPIIPSLGVRGEF